MPDPIYNQRWRDRTGLHEVDPAGDRHDGQRRESPGIQVRNCGLLQRIEALGPADQPVDAILEAIELEIALKPVATGVDRCKALREVRLPPESEAVGVDVHFLDAALETSRNHASQVRVDRRLAARALHPVEASSHAAAVGSTYAR